MHAEDRRHVEFLAGADLVIHDAMYSLDEYPQKRGWGHTPAEYAVDYAIAAGAKRLALTHHDPLRDDDAVDRLVAACQQRVVAAGSPLQVFGAAEGQEVRLVGHEADASATAAPPERTLRAESLTILVADDDPTVVRLLSVALEQDGFRVVTASDGTAALDRARRDRPALILLDWHMPGADGIEVMRTLRGESDPALREVPIVLITAQSDADGTAAGFAAGATDYLTKPFRAAHVRARVQAWLLRRRDDATRAP
jgi:CheY-like chemotaxis protein